MSDSKSIVSTDDRVKGFWEDLKAHAFNSVRSVITDQKVIHACRSAQWSYRERCLPPVLVVLHMVLAAIWPEDWFAASWQVLWAGACGNVRMRRQTSRRPTPVPRPGHVGAFP